MHTPMMMTVNPIPPATVVREDGGSGGFRQFSSECNEHDIKRRPRDDEFRVLSFQSHHPEIPKDKDRCKKDKKWSIGKLFRRKKKEDSDSSSESDEGISTKSETKRKVKKKKRPTAVSVSNFDHIVVNRDERRAQSVAMQNTKELLDEGVLSDPSAGFVGYRGRTVPYGPNYIISKESLNVKDDSGSRSGNVSIEGSVRRGRKGRMKARVEALRNSMRKDSSSDEESQKSSTSSSLLRFRSDDSLMHHPRSRDGSANRKSRSARTERYIKRLSRDEENQLNKEAELLQQGYTKAEVEMLTRTPTSQSSGYGTSKRENTYSATKEEPVYSNDLNRQPMKSESLSSFPSTHSYPSSINFNAKINNESVHYSFPYVRNNFTNEPMYINQIQDRRSQEKYSVGDNNIMCVKFPLGNVTNMARDEKAPPVPPPRDLHRKVATPVSMLLETEQIRSRNRSEDRTLHGVPNNDFHRVMRRSQERSLNPTINGFRRPLSNSEDHIVMDNQEQYRYSSFLRRPEQPRRPASVSVEPNHYGLYANTPWRSKFDSSGIIKPDPVKQEFLYYADQSPRSRRPISIQSSHTNLDNQCCDDSQSSLQNQQNNIDLIQRKPRNASEFWRKIDNDERRRKAQNGFPITRTMSEQSTNSVLNSPAGTSINGYRNNRDHLIYRNNNSLFNHNGNKLSIHNTSRDTVDGSHRWKSATEYSSLTSDIPHVSNPHQKTHTRHSSESKILTFPKSPSDDEKSLERRKSTNLDDALNELEAIYNSLGLGDEDLLDRAERRELMSPKSNAQVFNDWNGNDGIQFRSQPVTPLKRHPIPRRSTLPDKIQDDMAFRRLNSKDKPQSKDSSTAQISYMLASPVYVPFAHEDDKNGDGISQEPDIVQDDVVYRNIRHANNHLKQLEPQPPFGIPVGPVTPAPQSDYLHATPDNKARSRFVPRRSPDLVSDDLAYRNLRKDNRHSSLFGVDHETRNNFNSYEPLFQKDSADNLRKKRAVRSLSANIFTMIQKEIDDALNMSKLATLQKAQSINDVNKTLKQSQKKEDSGPRNKVKQRHHTVNIVVNNSSTPYKSDDSFVYKDEKYLAKPPSGDKSKCSSPARSPQPTKKPTKDEFQQVLSMLAQEAMDTSNKLGIALAELDKSRSKKSEGRHERLNCSEARTKFLKSLSNRSTNSESSPEIKYAKEGSEVNEPIFDQLNVNKGQKTEDSLLAISDQLHKVEDKLKHSFERVVHVPDESSKLSSYIVKTEEKFNAEECKIAVPENKSSPNIVEPSVQKDIVIVQNFTNNNPCSVTPKEKRQDQVNQINEIKSFNDLKDGISDLLAGISQVNDRLFNGNSNNIDKKDVKRNSMTISVYEDDLLNSKDNQDNLESTEYNSSEELATIFNLDSKKLSEPDSSTSKEDKHSELNSPKLVQSVNQKLRRLSNDCTDKATDSNKPTESDKLMDNDKPSQSSAVPTVPWRTKKHNDESQSERRGDK